MQPTGAEAVHHVFLYRTLNMQFARHTLQIGFITFHFC